MASFGGLGKRALKDPIEIRRKAAAERRYLCVEMMPIVLAVAVRGEWPASGQAS